MRKLEIHRYLYLVNCKEEREKREGRGTELTRGFRPHDQIRGH